MKASQGTAAQKGWMATVRQLGMGKIIHHCTDRTMRIKINYVSENIGHWFIVPCTDPDHHKYIHQGMGHNRKQYEKDRFEVVCGVAKAAGYELPFSDEIYKAIMEFHK